jgi:dCMP deaminase
VGSVIVNDRKQIVGIGFNGFPRGIDDNDEMYKNRDTKLLYVCHAERNALDSCLVDLHNQNTTIYCTFFPCTDCAKGIIQRGVKRVVTTLTMAERYHPVEVVDMFQQAGVKLEFITEQE